MTTTDDATLFQWLDAAAEGTLAEGDRKALDLGVETRPELADEAQAFVRLHRLLALDRLAVREGFALRVIEEVKAFVCLDRLLANDRITVREGFTQRVAAAVVAPSVLARGAWRLPVALAATLAVAGSLLLVLSGSLSSGSLGTVAALVDFFQTAALTGAGLLGATWQGVTLAFDEILLGSRTSLVALVVGVVFLDLLFLRLLRRRPQPIAARDDAGDASR